MNQARLVTVIVPCYNAAAFLKRGIASLQAQSYKNLEIICINDGSSDNSLDMLKAFQLKDSRIKIISFKHNKGVSAARNAGLDCASGEYICFLDPDDQYMPNFVELMLTALQHTGCDLALCSVTTETESTGKRRCNRLPRSLEHKDKVKLNELSPDDFFSLRPECWCRMYKRSGILAKIRFQEDLHIGEDVLFCYKLLLCCESLALINAPLYLYRQSEQSVSKSVSKIFLECPVKLLRLYQLLVKYHLLPQMQSAYEIYAVKDALYNYEHVPKEQQEYFRQMIHQLIKHCGIELKSPPSRLSCFISFLSYKLSARSDKRMMLKKKHINQLASRKFFSTFC